MRDFFIQGLEYIINVLVGLAVLGVVVASVAGFAGMIPNARAFPGGSAGIGLAILVGGGLYVLLIGGFMFLGLGIYQNTRRTAQALEAMARRG